MEMRGVGACLEGFRGWEAVLGFSWAVGCHPGVGADKWQLGRVDAVTALFLGKDKGISTGDKRSVPTTGTLLMTTHFKFVFYILGRFNVFIYHIWSRFRSP
jgi:hypothetical protein